MPIEDELQLFRSPMQRNWVVFKSDFESSQSDAFVKCINSGIC